MKFQGFQTGVNQRRSFSEVGRGQGMHNWYSPYSMTSFITQGYSCLFLTDTCFQQWWMFLKRQCNTSWSQTAKLSSGTGTTVFAFLPQICAAYLLVVSFQKELKKKQKQKQSKNKTKQNETKLNETKRNETKRNETKRNETKQNKQNKPKKTKQSKTKQNRNKNG